MLPRLRLPASLVATCLLLLGCATVSAPFDQTALDQATAVKRDALALLGQATGPFAPHAAEASALTAQVKAAADYAAARPKNKEAAQQWAILADPDANSLAGLLKRWQVEGGLSPAFVQEATGLVEEGLDKIIQLEEHRRR